MPRDSLDSIIEKVYRSPSAQPPKYQMPPKGLTRNKSTSSIPSSIPSTSSSAVLVEKDKEKVTRVARSARVQRQYLPPQENLLDSDEELSIVESAEIELRRSLSFVKGKQNQIEYGMERLTEWTERMWIWEKDTGATANNKNLIRDVPAAVKRKIAKRESSQLLAGAELNPSDRLLREKGSRSNMSTSTTSSNGGFGNWVPIVATVKDDGTLTICSELDTIKYRFNLTSFHQSDIHTVDPSLFHRSNVFSIRPVEFGKHASTSSHTHPITQTVLSSYVLPSSNDTEKQTTLPSLDVDEPIFLACPDQNTLERWIAMCKAHSIPEIYPYLPYQDSPLSNNQQIKWQGLSTTLPTTSTDQCRIWRSVEISINEGKNLGTSRMDSGTMFDGILGGSRLYFARPTTSPASPSPREENLSFIPSQSTAKKKDDKESDGLWTSSSSYFVQILINGEVSARTVAAKANVIVWHDHFTFSNLGPYNVPVVLELYQQRGGKHAILGNVVVDLTTYQNGSKGQEWFNVVRGREIVGELNVTIKTFEQPVLAKEEYDRLSSLIFENPGMDVAREIASEITDLGNYASIMLRILDSSQEAVERIVQMALVEISTFSGNPTTLFRGNSLFTKLVETFMRTRAMDYIERSVGEVVKKICSEKVAIEIDPSRCKNDKEVRENVKELKKWSELFWNHIYESRDSCPPELKFIFYHIQLAVKERFKKDQEVMRFTSISAFIFLRFLVPAILHPKLWGVVPKQPGEGCRRTLTLVGKTLQGLANMSTSFQEPGMKIMSDFLTEHQSAFIDYITVLSNDAEFHTSPSDEWTAPRQFRSTLGGLAKDSVPTVPHLNDEGKDLALLVDCVVNSVQRDSTGSMSRERSSKANEFVRECYNLHDRAGTVAISNNLLQPFVVVLPRRQKRSIRVSQTSRPRTGNEVPSVGFMHRVRSNVEDHITPPSSPKASVQLIPPLGSSPSSTSISKRTRRSYTVTNHQSNHPSPPRRSISSERLAQLAAKPKSAKVPREPQVHGKAFPDHFQQFLNDHRLNPQDEDEKTGRRDSAPVMDDARKKGLLKMLRKNSRAS